MFGGFIFSQIQVSNVVIPGSPEPPEIHLLVLPTSDILAYRGQYGNLLMSHSEGDYSKSTTEGGETAF